MANVTFWKGSATQFAGKTYVDGRIYFVTDDDNLGSLYLGVAEGETVKAVMISPERLTDLSKLEEGDVVSSVTAKAVVDFVNAQFAEGSAYAEAISGINAAIALKADKATYEAKVEEIEGRLDATEGVANGAAAAVATKVEQEAYDAKVEELENAIKAITGEGEEGDATTIAGLAVKVSTLEGEMDDAEGRLDTIEGQLEGIEGTVTAAISGAVSASEATIQGKLDLKANAADVYTKEEVGNMLSAALEFKGTKATAEELPTDAETGDVYFVTSDQSEYVFVKGTGEVADKWEKLGPVVDYTQFAQASNVYTKGEVDSIVDGLEGRLDATEGVANGAAAAVATKVEQEAYNTKMGELDGAIADRYTKSEVYTKGEVDSAISAATLVWVED